jgi:hypothetical protein
MMSTEKRQDDWIVAARRKNPSLFFELNLLLKALEKFFMVDYLPLSDTQYSTRNFYPELSAGKDIIIKVLEIFDSVIPEEKKNAFRLKKFTEIMFLSDRGRDLFRESLYKQDTREKSLFLLYDSFINMKTIVTDLLMNANITFITYRNVGQLISKEIRENVFFNPFRKDVDLEMDYIDNREIAEIVKTLGDRELKKIISILMLHLFRILRYLRHINRETDQPVALMHTSVGILTLLRAEIEFLRTYSDKFAGKLKEENVSMLLRTVSYQFKMESRRVFSQELRDVLEKKFYHQMNAKIEKSYGILNNLTEQTIIQLAQFWKPNLKGEEVFEDFVTKAEMSIKLREDMHVLKQLLSLFEKNKGQDDLRESRMHSLMEYMDYFENFTFELIRNDDYEEFTTLFSDIKTASSPDKLIDKCHQLGVLTGAVLGQIENRAELKDRPLDVEKAENIVKQYASIM